jgi:tetratricopeptide (TPR) repeat protein
VELDRFRDAAAATAADTEAARPDHWSREVIGAAILNGLPGQRRKVHAIALLIGIAGMSAGAMAAPPSSPLVGPIVQFIDTQELEDHAEIAIQFACSVNYVSNTPISHGSSTTIKLRLGPDCGTQLGPRPPELPLIGGGGQLVTGARVDSMLPGEITLELTWSRPLDFVMAPTAAGLGLRVRLLNTNRRKGSVLVSEPEAPAGYSVNLDSSQAQFSRETVEAAAAALQTQAYVSETDIEDEHWYRLRAGPFTTRKEAERVLGIALASYPRAWLSVNEELADLSGVERAGVQSTVASGPTDPPLPDEQRAQLLHDAHEALEKHKYPEAVDLLNRLLRQPEFPARAECQELLGLVRERAGQLAQAKAEYEEYLRRYPDGPGAARVRGRLQALAAASLAPKSTGVFGEQPNGAWSMAGSAAISYQYGREQTSSAGTTTTTNSLNSALVYGDLLLRDRGQRYDFTARLDGGYTHDLGSTSGGSEDRTTAAYAEVTDRQIGLTGRLGRQSLASQGVVGLFDGLYVNYQLNSKWSFGGAAGLPAYTSYSAVSSQQKFGTLTAEFNPFHQAWIFDAYVFNETNGGLTERRSIGFQTRYSELGRTAVVLIDYDLAFQELNSATVIGNTRVGSEWVIGFNADYRHSPPLALSNALIGQSAPDLPTLLTQFTPSQVKQLALDRTAKSDTFVISASRPLGERWQFMADISTIELSGTPASGGVAATESTGLDKNVALQMSGSSLLQSSDLHIFSVRFDDSPTARSTTLAWDARFVLPGAWRLGPRLSVEQLKDPSLGRDQMLYLPQVRGDWTSRTQVFEITAGYQMQNQQALQQQQILTGEAAMTAIAQRSLYISAAYRVRF